MPEFALKADPLEEPAKSNPPLEGSALGGLALLDELAREDAVSTELGARRARTVAPDDAVNPRAWHEPDIANQPRRQEQPEDRCGPG